MIINSQLWITRASYPFHGEDENALGVKFIDLENGSIKEINEDVKGVKISTNSEDKLKALKKYQHIEAIDLSLSDVTCDALKELKNFPNLKAINLSENTIDNEWLEIISKLDQLEELDTPGIRTGMKRDNLDFKYFKEFKNLKILITGNITDKYIESLSHLGSLQEFKIDSVHNSFSDDGLEILSGISSLEALWILNSGKTTTEGYKHLARLKFLHTFVIAGRTSCLADEEMIFPFDDESLKALVDLPISYLYLEKCKLTDKSLPIIKEFSNLSSLEIVDCEYMNFYHINGIEMLNDCIQTMEDNNDKEKTNDTVQSIQNINKKAVFQDADKNFTWEIKTENNKMTIKYGIKDRVFTTSLHYPNEVDCNNAALNEIKEKLLLYKENNNSIFNDEDNNNLLAEKEEEESIKLIYSNLTNDLCHTFQKCKDILLDVKDRIAVMTAMKEAAYYILRDIEEHEDNVRLYGDISGTDSYFGTCDYFEKSIIASIIIELGIARDLNSKSKFADDYLETRKYEADEFSSSIWQDDPHNPVYKKLLEIVDVNLDG